MRHIKMTSPFAFKPLGPAPIQDPFVARLNRAAPWGSGKATGAINTLELVQDETTKDAVLFAGSVNGGVWSRKYDGLNDRWDDWSWISNSADYTGVQSISKLRVSEDGKRLIVAAGGVSSWRNIRGDIQNPLQLAALNSDGSFRAWIKNTDGTQDALAGQDINALETIEDLVIIGTNRGLYVGEINEKLKGIVASVEGELISSIAISDSGRIYLAVPSKGVFTATISELRQDRSNANIWKIVAGSQDRSINKLAKLSITSDPTSGDDVLYMGTAEFNPQTGLTTGGYKTIHRVIYNPNTSLDWVDKDVTGNIGTDTFNGLHMSFSADPTDSNRVFAGANYLNAYPNTFNGGLVAITFDGSDVTLDNQFTSVANPSSAGGTAPHADSRDIAFLKTKIGATKIVEADDGGVYIKGIDLEDPWQSLLNEGLRTTESFASDWSNIGNIAITAMQDNATAVAKYNSAPSWLNVTGGDGAIARFDDAAKDSNDGYAYAYYGSQSYSSNGIIEAAAYDESGILKYTDRLELEVLDEYGNLQDFLNYDMIFTGFNPDNQTNYPFYLPFETNAYRAGDVVLAGQRNLYEQLIPHWQLPTAGEMWLLPLIEDLVDNQKVRTFTAVEVGSSKGESFPTRKPYSWDSLYTSFREVNSAGVPITYLYGRKAGETTEDQSENAITFDQLKLENLTEFLPDIAQQGVITGISINPDNSDQIWASISSDHVMYGSSPRTSAQFSQPSYLIYSSNGGREWETIVESGSNGIPRNAQLQQVQYIRAGDGTAAEIYLGGYGGVWSATIDDNGKPNDFKNVSWDGLDIDPNSFKLWNTNLEYDPVDNVLIASILGQGTWLLERSALAKAPSAEAGLRITPVWLPQDNSFLKRKKNRYINGVVTVALERTDANRDEEVRVDLVLPDYWKTYLSLPGNEPQLDQLPKKNSITLSFPSGVNQLSLGVSTALQGVTLPDIVLDLRLENPVNSSIASDSSSAPVYLYANGETISLRQEATGVFYSDSTAFERHFNLPSQAQALGVLMPRVGLNEGDQLFWYAVSSDGSVLDENNKRILPADANYQKTIERTLLTSPFNLIATATKAYDPRAFSPEKAALAFSNPNAVIVSEGISIGDLVSAAESTLPSQERFSLALRGRDGSIRLSTQGFGSNQNPALDNAVTIGGSSDVGSQVVLAPAGGELFVADINFLPAGSAEPSSTIDYNLEVARFGSYNSGYGIFRVDDALGSFRFIDGALVETPIQIGTIDYAKEAFRRSASNGVDGITGLPIPGFAQSIKETISLATGNYYGIYITPDQVLGSEDQLSDLSSILFSIKNANQNQQLQHVSMGTGYFAFEDMGFAGDRDFNDMLFAITPVIPVPA